MRARRLERPVEITRQNMAAINAFTLTHTRRRQSRFMTCTCALAARDCRANASAAAPSLTPRSRRLLFILLVGFHAAGPYAWPETCRPLHVAAQVWLFSSIFSFYSPSLPVSIEDVQRTHQTSPALPFTSDLPPHATLGHAHADVHD